MSNLFNIILIVVAFLGILYLVKKKSLYQKPKHIAIIDPAAQKLYDTQKHHTKEEKKLTLEEKIKLSWQFLINIKEQVLQRFSSEDKEKLHQSGQLLAQNGMHYQHDIDQEAKIKLELSRTESIKQPKQQNQSISM